MKRGGGRASALAWTVGNAVTAQDARVCYMGEFTVGDRKRGSREQMHVEFHAYFTFKIFLIPPKKLHSTVSFSGAQAGSGGENRGRTRALRHFLLGVNTHTLTTTKEERGRQEASNSSNERDPPPPLLLCPSKPMHPADCSLYVLPSSPTPSALISYSGCVC